MSNGVKYAYGMRLRPCGIGCQPKGFTDVLQDESGEYWNVLFYGRRLEAEEVSRYEMDYLGEVM